MCAPSAPTNPGPKRAAMAGIAAPPGAVTLTVWLVLAVWPTVSVTVSVTV